MTTIDELAARVAALEAQAQSTPDTLQSNVITVENGVIGASFTGLIKALGLVIPEGTGSTPEFDNSITWRRANGAKDSNGNDPVVIGATAGDLNGVETEYADFGVNAVLPSLVALLTLTAYNAGNAGNVAQLSVQADNQDATTNTKAYANGITRTIIDGAAGSNFLQINGAPIPIGLVLGVGQLPSSIPGGGELNLSAIAHGLTDARGIARAPRIAGAFPDGWVGYFGNWTSPDATYIYLNASAHDGAGAGSYFYWFAIG